MTSSEVKQNSAVNGSQNTNTKNCILSLTYSFLIHMNKTRERHKRKTKDVVKNKVEAVFWLIAASLVLNATDLLHVMYRDQRVNRYVSTQPLFDALETNV
jgi:hypothetical protein